ncbi:MFS transporter [Sulfoacidibacillus thermotolerans]|uniref:MFS transporter n=1 Tax=Sulfoacidibacillus thermotolerans TaxID=1765684 RepID=A0A2U3D694_SULT2|nr:MFS transporter [Sulfoacidibacillus thermotolerans]PWI56796.1 MFS transporter [Sulfoacidibacillus thermotolerans]
MIHPETTNSSSKDSVKALIGIGLAWAFDAMDFSILTFVLVDIMKAYHVPLTLAAGVASATTFARLGGGFLGGLLGDYWGRKASLVLSIFWFSLFEFLTGFSIGFSLLYLVRILYGVGMGAMYANGTPMLMELMPSKWRGIASGIMQSGFSFGYIFAALIYRNGYSALGWHGMFYIACIPAILIALYIWWQVPESSRWKEERDKRENKSVPISHLFSGEHAWGTFHAAIMSVLAFSVTYPINVFYATLLIKRGHFSPATVADTIILLNVAGIIGNVIGGYAADVIGRKWTIVISGIATLFCSFLFLDITNDTLRIVFTFLIGLFSIGGVWAAIPTYIAEHFQTSVRSTGQGTTYHFGAAVGGAIVPLIVSSIASSVGGLAWSMTYSVAIAAILVSVFALFYKETKGMELE